MSDIVIPGNPGRDRVTCSSSIARSLRSSRFSDLLVSDGLLVRLVELDMHEPGWFKIAQSGVIFSVVLRGNYESSYFKRSDSDVRESSFRIYSLEQRMDQLISFREPSDVRLLQIAIRADTLMSMATAFGYDGEQLLKAATGCCRKGQEFSVPNRALPTVLRSVAEEAFLTQVGPASRPMVLYAKAIDILAHGFEYLLGNGCAHEREEDVTTTFEAVRDLLGREFRDPRCTVGLAERYGLPDRKLVGEFQARFGVTPATFVARLRMFEARRLLEHSRSPVNEICREVGFSDHAAFTRAFMRFFGCTPSSLRRCD